ncbi:MFS transporter [Solicola gregarius]|uniref:MFS transporter n=1 Tax=Solicola gregarius TaxID=2908642 RepID=A0AA46YNZ6_9ACTN|nr:MFS transporter [Solicola gregarius]UYM07138.1 MFS transporter [Solicola gregarius]
MTVSVSEVPAAHSAPRRMSNGALIAVLVAASLPVMSFFGVNVALGQIGAELHASPAVLQLVVATYGITYASLVVIGGRLGDAFGRRRMIQLGLGGFAVASVLCSIAQSPGQLVAARLIQGVAAALIAPQVLATIHASNEGHHRDRAVGMFGATAGVATSIAFLVAGALTSSGVDWLGWRAVFWVTAPVAVVVMFAVARWMPDVRGHSRPQLDLAGVVLLGAAMTLLIGPLTEGRAVGWPAWTWFALAAFVPVAIGFGWWQRRAERTGGMPLVPPSMLAMRSMAVGLAIGAPFFTAFGGFMFVYALCAQSSGMSPLETGVSLLPMSVSFLFASIVAGRLVARFGVSVLTIGAVLAALGYAAVGYAVQQNDPSHVATVLPAMMVCGLGVGLVWSPLFGIVLSQVPAERAGLGSGILITTLQLFLGLGAAVVGSLYLGLVPGRGASDAFGQTLLPLAIAMLVIAGLTRALVPRRERDVATVG